MAAVKAVLADTSLYGNDRLVMLTLAERANEHPEYGAGQIAWPSMADIAARANIAHIAGVPRTERKHWDSAIRSTRRVVKRLRDGDEPKLEVIGQRPKGNHVFRLNLTPDISTPSGVTSQPVGQDTSTRTPGVQVSPEPKEPEEKSQEESRIEIPEVHDPKDQEQVDAFFNAKREQIKANLREKVRGGCTYSMHVLDSMEREDAERAVPA